MENNTIQTNLFDYFAESEGFTTADAYKAVETAHLEVNRESIRARIYEGVEKGLFEKIARGVYKVIRKTDTDESVCLLVNGNGRDLSMIDDGSIDAIITDHPYMLTSALKGGNRDFASYDLFRYTQEDFNEKKRVLKDGGFLVEFIPTESEANFEYLYEIKKYAINAGLKYYSKVPWVKGTFVANTGRCSKNSEDMIFFTKGEPRRLKLDAKKNLARAKENGIETKGLTSYEVRDLLVQNGLEISYMKGAAGMLPTDFNYQPKSSKDKVMEAEKPVELLASVIEYITLPGETVLDQFAGSHNLALAGIQTGRNVVTFEKDEKIFSDATAYIEKNLDSGYRIENQL